MRNQITVSIPNIDHIAVEFHNSGIIKSAAVNFLSIKEFIKSILIQIIL